MIVLVLVCVERKSRLFAKETALVASVVWCVLLQTLEAKSSLRVFLLNWVQVFVWCGVEKTEPSYSR